MNNNFSNSSSPTSFHSTSFSVSTGDSPILVIIARYSIHIHQTCITNSLFSCWFSHLPQCSRRQLRKSSADL